MGDDHDQGSEEHAQVWWTLPAPGDRSRRPSWAIPVFIAGIVCSLIIALISFNYARSLAEGAPPSIAMVYGLYQVPFIVAALALLPAGALGTFRPQTQGRPWINVVIVVASIAWLFVAYALPGLLAS